MFDLLDAIAGDLFSAMLLVVVAILAWLVRDARRDCARQQRRAEEAEMWLMLADEEIAAVRKHLADAERRHAHVQALYADLVRQRLAENWRLITTARQRK